MGKSGRAVVVAAIQSTVMVTIVTFGEIITQRFKDGVKVKLEAGTDVVNKTVFFEFV